MKHPRLISIAIVASVVLLGFLPTSCRKTAGTSHTDVADTVGLKDSADRIYNAVIHCYNNNLHDSLVMLVPKSRELYQRLGLWKAFYNAWCKLGEEYNWSGEPDSAIMEAQKIHDHAKDRGDEYGLAIADYIKGLVYDMQHNNKESARILEQALNRCKDEDHHLKNNIFSITCLN